MWSFPETWGYTPSPHPFTDGFSRRNQPYPEDQRPHHGSEKGRAEVCHQEPAVGDPESGAGPERNVEIPY